MPFTKSKPHGDNPSLAFRNPYNLRDPRSLVEASFMMMNQVDSSSFDDDKDDDKKAQRMISRLSQKVQDQD